MDYKEVVNTLKKMITYNLDEINKEKNNEFIEGEITAYTDCLEMIEDLTKGIS